jgi:hypothetical protein
MKSRRACIRRILPPLLISLGICVGGAMDTKADLEQGFANPPSSTRPWCYWYWFNDHISQEGITHDLEAMARVGIGEALMANIFQPDYPVGNIKVLSEEWWQLVEHTIREGGRVGVDIGLFNCPGWSMSGGPWIKPEQTMRYLASSEVRVQGPLDLTQKLAQPTEHFQDIAVLAFPAPRADAETLRTQSPRVVCVPAVAGAERLVDGDLEKPLIIPVAARGSFAIELAAAHPFTARSLSIYPGGEAFGANCLLEAADSEGQFRPIRQFRFDRANMNPGLGPLPRGPVTVSFPATTATKFRVTFSAVYYGRLRGSTLSSQVALTEVDLCGAARLEGYIEKQLGKMHATPTPLWDAYLWPPPPEPDTPDLAIASAQSINLTSNLAADGTLRWKVPPGDWIILRTGMAPTGVKNAPASPEATGLEVDKMSRPAVRAHFNGFIGQVLKRMPAADRKAFKHVVADSYEMGSQNWTDGFASTFRKRYGYDPLPWLPVLTGRIVGSADQSERFLWDLRRLVADHIAKDYVGGLRDVSHEQGLKLWLENYGHWGFAGEFLQYGGESDCVAGEYWNTKGLGSIEVRAATSCANTYGKAVAAAESFTSGPKFQLAPRGLKALGDWAFCEGINHFVLHTYLHQPWDDRKPGVNAPWPTEFNRQNTWFEQGRAWVDYVRRCSYLLQQGYRVADVVYFIGEDAPKMTGVRQPPLPPGRDFDYINGDVIETRLAVKDGLLSLPHGTTYRLLVLPPMETMRPGLLRSVQSLVRAGATVFGPAPLRSPSLENYPRCDAEVRKLAAELWGNDPAAKGGERKLGKGRIMWGDTWSRALDVVKSVPDFMSEPRLRFTHRRSGTREIYFVANPTLESISTIAAFRVSGKMPERWWPDTGKIERPAVYEAVDGSVRMPICLGPNGSVFVLFDGKEAPAAEQVLSVTRDGAVQVTTKPPPDASQGANRDNFSFAVWARPIVDTTLAAETNRGIWNELRNDVVSAPHGSDFGRGHARCGLAVGRNGVVVYEDAADCLAPVLVHESSLPEWTHVALVYQDGQPNLYLNGVFARRGLRSGFTVHAGAGAGDGVMPFRGEIGMCRQFARALTEAEIAELARTMPNPETVLPPSAIQVCRTETGTLEALVWERGIYSLQTSAGKSHTVEVSSALPAITLSSPWRVHFPAGGGAPDEVVFDRLVDWTQRPEAGIRYYSGAATYQTTFTLPPQTRDQRLWLDLGRVRDLATVSVNGKKLGTLWLAPWRMDITAATRAGDNLLEVEVVNTWNNRLVGDANLPPDQRTTYLLTPVVEKNAPLLPAGLLGPVTIRTAQRVLAR